MQNLFCNEIKSAKLMSCAKYIFQYTAHASDGSFAYPQLRDRLPHPCHHVLSTFASNCPDEPRRSRSHPENEKVGVTRHLTPPLFQSRWNIYKGSKVDKIIKLNFIDK